MTGCAVAILLLIAGCASVGGQAAPPTEITVPAPPPEPVPKSAVPLPPTTPPSQTSSPTNDFPKVSPNSNVTLTKLAPGEQPPQFIIFSFDGAGWHTKWQEFMTAANKVNARFTGFLTGIYLLDDDHASAYTGPGHPQGKASVSFGGSADDVYTLVNDLNQAYAAGNEIGTHYNGHFCAGSPPSGKDWDTDQWNTELGEFFDFWDNWQMINGYKDAPTLNVPRSEVKGGRTPCLEGQWDQLQPAWAKAGFTYDSSIPGSGIAWPRQQYGVWEFSMQSTNSPTLGSVMAMDYNFWYKYNKAKNAPDEASEITSKVLATYEHMYDAASTGNRAPILIANHFNTWSGNAFNPAAKQFMLEACGRENTICATYSDVIAWMEYQDPAVLAELQARPPVS